MQKLIGCLAICLVVFCAVGLAETGCGCDASAMAQNGEKGIGEKNDDELSVTSEEAQEAMEWQCIVVDIIIEYVNCETRPCDSLYWTCVGLCDTVCCASLVAACGAIFAQGLPLPSYCYFAGIPCLAACPALCRDNVPWCEYCDTEVTYVYSCGWVFTE